METWTNPQEWTTDGSTPLYPYRKSANPEEFWTSNDLRDTTKLVRSAAHGAALRFASPHIEGVSQLGTRCFAHAAALS